MPLSGFLSLILLYDPIFFFFMQSFKFSSSNTRLSYSITRVTPLLWLCCRSSRLLLARLFERLKVKWFGISVLNKHLNSPRVLRLSKLAHRPS